MFLEGGALHLFYTVVFKLLKYRVGNFPRLGNIQLDQYCFIRYLLFF